LRNDQALLIARGISKRFGPALALDRVAFTARPGAIHALIGENGAGKSTLVNILAGRIPADRGAITLDGAALSGRSPTARLRAGVAAVFQSPMLFERMAWEENLAFGSFAGGRRRLDPAAISAQAHAVAKTLGLQLPPRGVDVAQLSLTDRVRLEILRALSFAPRVLILDEPTSVLAPGELACFLELLRRLRAEERSVILVTHKLGEALAVADEITILRAGRKIAHRRAAETDEAELARLMIGATPLAPAARPATSSVRSPALTLEEINVDYQGRRVLDSISLQVRRGEIAGLAGVDGNGQTELAALLAGNLAPSAGRVEIAGASAIAVLPQNRDLDGLILEMTIWENLLLARRLRARFVGVLGGLWRAAARDFCAATITQYAIRAPHPDAPAAALSGGNRQRLTIARALASDPRVIVAHDISRGLDLNATAEVHRRLREYAAAGGAVLLISNDLDEIFTLCQRIYVISGGRLREVPPHDRKPERLGLLMSGAAS
jgi:ABC-type uncharacterized transport system ATPase subunit